MGVRVAIREVPLAQSILVSFYISYDIRQYKYNLCAANIPGFSGILLQKYIIAIAILAIFCCDRVQSISGLLSTAIQCNE